MLVGEAGIGKTRTAAEFPGQAHSAGALVLRGSCYEGEWAPPYGPFVEALTARVVSINGRNAIMPKYRTLPAASPPCARRPPGRPPLDTARINTLSKPT